MSTREISLLMYHRIVIDTSGKLQVSILVDKNASPEPGLESVMGLSVQTYLTIADSYDFGGVPLDNCGSLNYLT